MKISTIRKKPGKVVTILKALIIIKIIAEPFFFAEWLNIYFVLIVEKINFLTTAIVFLLIFIEL